jgi:hypothetical protein
MIQDFVAPTKPLINSSYRQLRPSCDKGKEIEKEEKS